jgi:hypothetical protein
MNVYHYCSLETFYKIISQSSILLFNNLSMNDKHEGTWISRVIEMVIRENNIATLGDLGLLIQQHNANNSRPIFLSCFSEEGDLLSQWRAYSNDATGLSIGIEIESSDINRQSPSPSAGPHNNHSIGWVKLEYDLKKQKELVYSLINNFLETISDKDKDTNIVLYSILLNILSITFKNESFREEREWRIVHTPSIIYKDNHEIIGGKLSNLDFLPIKNTIRPYFRCDINKKCIKEIFIGPKCPINILDLELFLNHNNIFDANIKPSVIPYI